VRKFFRGFSYAVKGLMLAVTTQLNFRVQLILAVITVLAGAWLRLRKWEWAALILCIGTVLAAEAINTALEEITNVIYPEYDLRAAKIKDLAAAAVLIVCLAAVVLALLIFLPKIARLVT